MTVNQAAVPPLISHQWQPTTYFAAHFCAATIREGVYLF